MLALIARDPKYGWIPDLPDQRDFTYLKLVAKIPSVPPKVDLRQTCSPIEDQGNLGSCTACALVGNLEFLKFKTQPSLDFSELFLYYNERAIRHTVNTDSGASLRDGIKTLIKVGDCEEPLWPYVIPEFTERPSPAVYQNALTH
jgi:C1A family cysteine protease